MKKFYSALKNRQVDSLASLPHGIEELKK